MKRNDVTRQGPNKAAQNMGQMNLAGHLHDRPFHPACGQESTADGSPLSVRRVRRVFLRHHHCVFSAHLLQVEVFSLGQGQGS